jgi:hypothetical protein
VSSRRRNPRAPVFMGVVLRTVTSTKVPRSTGEPTAATVWLERHAGEGVLGEVVEPVVIRIVGGPAGVGREALTRGPGGEGESAEDGGEGVGLGGCWFHVAGAVAGNRVEAVAGAGLAREGGRTVWGGDLPELVRSGVPRDKDIVGDDA